MLTVAEGGVLGACVIEAQPARRIVMLVKIELIRLVFIVFELLIINYRDFSALNYKLCQADEELPIGL